MSRTVLPWLLVGGATAAIVYFSTRRGSADEADEEHHDAQLGAVGDARLRNAGLIYRPVGEVGERYPDWLIALKRKSGVYIIRERQRDGSSPVVYVGESHTGRLYQTLTRHFQTWRLRKKFWSGQYTGSQAHDPGLTYDRGRVTVAARVISDERAIAEEARLIARLRPRDNLIGQPDDSDDAVPF